MKYKTPRFEIKYSKRFADEALGVAEQLFAEKKMKGHFWENLSVYIDNKPGNLVMVLSTDSSEILKGKIVYLGFDA